MRVLVFGATGRTGSLVVERALKVGHVVTAFTRNPAAVQRDHDHLQTASGDVLDAAAVLRAVEEQDAVISVYGVRFDPLHKITIFSAGTRNIVQSMEHHGVQRYVGVTSGGTSEASQPGSGLVFEWVFKRGIGRTHYADQRRQEQIVIASSLRWTIARPARLADGPASGSYLVERGYVVPGEHTTVRADLAEFLVRALEEPEWEQQGVAIVSPGTQRSTRSNRLPFAAAGLAVAAGLGIGWRLSRGRRR